MKEWIANKRALSINMLEKEAELPQGTLRHYLSGSRNLPEKHREALLVVLKKYGFKGNIGTNN